MATKKNTQLFEQQPCHYSSRCTISSISYYLHLDVPKNFVMYLSQHHVPTRDTLYVKSPGGQGMGKRYLVPTNSFSGFPPNKKDFWRPGELVPVQKCTCHRGEAKRLAHPEDRFPSYPDTAPRWATPASLPHVGD